MRRMEEFKEGKWSAIEMPEVRKLKVAEAKILKLLKGWTLREIECLLIHRVLIEAKRQAKL